MDVIEENQSRLVIRSTMIYAKFTLTFDKNEGSLTCQSDDAPIAAGNIRINPTKVNLDDLTQISRFSVGFILKDGNRVQYGQRNDVNQRMFFMGKTSSFLGLPVEEGYLDTLYKGSKYTKRSGMIISLIIVVLVYLVTLYFR